MSNVMSNARLKPEELPATYPELMKLAIDVMNRFESRQAEELFRFITSNFPHESQAWIGLAMTCYDRLKVEAAIEAFAQIGKSAGDWHLAENSVCHMHLVVGNYELGWKGYMKRNLSRLPDVTLLSADNTKTFKHLLILGEQGFGDMIQFSRFFINLRSTFPDRKISFLCPKPLHRLLEPFCDSLKIELVLSTEDNKFQLNDVSKDGLVYTHICSLASLFNCSMRNVNLSSKMALGYDKDNANKLRDKKKKSKKPLVGLCWAGKPMYSKDYKRSCPNDKVLQLIDSLPQCDFISLTESVPETQELHAPILAHTRVNGDRIGRVKDFYDTATLIKACDLVITVDTAVAHLSGSLFKPTYLMLPYAPDWRWKLGRRDSPWYPTFSVFRQRHLGRWENVIDEVSKSVLKDLRSGR